MAKRKGKRKGKYKAYQKVLGGPWRMRYTAANGRVITSAEAYERKAGALNAIEVLKDSKDAEVEIEPAPRKKKTVK